MLILSLITYPHVVPILDFWGPYAKTVSPAGGEVGVGMKEWMKRMCLAFEKHLFRGSVLFFFFCLMQETVLRSRYMIWLSFYLERVRAHRIKIIYHSCLHNHWPTL